MKNHVSIIIFILIGLSSCQKKDSSEIKYIDEDQRLVISLVKYESEYHSDHSYNYDFNIGKIKEEKTFYVPISFEKTYQCIPELMRTKLHIPSKGAFPFDTNTQMANIVTSWEGRDLIFQVQFSFFNNEKYASNFEDYFCITVSQHKINPFATKEEIAFFTEKVNKDIDDKYTVDYINNDHVYFKTQNNSEWPKNYANYEIDETGEYLQLISKNANQYFTWHDGLLYHIGYRITDTTNFKPDELLESIILG